MRNKLANNPDITSQRHSAMCETPFHSKKNFPSTPAVFTCAPAVDPAVSERWHTGHHQIQVTGTRFQLDVDPAGFETARERESKGEGMVDQEDPGFGYPCFLAMPLRA